MALELMSKTVRRFGWRALDNLSKAGISFVVCMVLVRLLSLDEYGLIGILAIFTVVFNSIVDNGFSQALIRKKDVSDVNYSMIFRVNLIVFIVMIVTFFFLANPIVSFFERMNLVPLARLVSVLVLINALALVQRTRRTKVINIKPHTKIIFISSLLGGAVGITAAYLVYGARAFLRSKLLLSWLQLCFCFFIVNGFQCLYIAK